MADLSAKDVFKRDAYNKIESLVQKIRDKLQKDMTPEERKRLLKKIAMVIMLFQVDMLYQKTTNTSGIVAILNSFGLTDRQAEKVKSLFLSGANVATLAIMIYKFMKEEK